MKNLIVYYSYEGNTEALVNGMKDVIDADIIKLEPVVEKKYKGLLKFAWGGNQVFMVKTPKLKPYKLDLKKYKNIIIGTPCWIGTFAPPIRTFLNDNKIKNKNIYLLVCNGGGVKNTFKDFEKALEGNTIISALDIVYPLKKGKEESIKTVNNWIKDNLK